MSHWIDSLARFVAHRPLATLAAIGTLIALLASGIPNIRADFTPSDLFARFEEEQRIEAEFRATFGNTDNVLLVLVEAPDVYSVPALEHVHTLARALQQQPWAGRVNALTLLPLPDTRPVELPPDSTYSVLYSRLGGVAVQMRRTVAELGGTSVPPPELPPAPAWLGTLTAGRATQVAPAVRGERVEVAEAEHIRSVVSSSPLLVGQLVSRDATLTAIAVQLADGYDRAAAVAEAVSEAVALVESTHPPAEVTVRLGGLPYLRSALSERIRADQSVMMPASVLICVLLLAVAFRWFPALLFPLVAVLASAAAMVGAMAWAGESFNILNNILPLLIVIIGISNAFHVLSRYMEELRHGRERHDAMARTVAAMAVACFLTSFTTAVGFGTLLVSRTQILQGFGLWAAIGVMIAYVVTLTLLPAALVLPGAPRVRSTTSAPDWLERRIVGLFGLGIRHPWPVVAVAGAVLVSTAFLGSRIRVDSAVLDQFDPADELYVTTRLIEERLAGVRPLEVYVQADTPQRLADPAVLDALDRVAAQARNLPGVIGTMSWSSYLREARVMVTGDPAARARPFAGSDDPSRYGALLSAGDFDPTRPWVNADRTRLRLSVQLRDVGARATIDVAHQVNELLRAELGTMDDVRFVLTGDAYASSIGLRAVIGDLGSSLGLAVLIIFVFITLLFRSPRLGLVSVPPNLTPLVLTLAWMAVSDIPLNAATVIIFSVSIGMGVDGTIHIFARVGEELRKGLDVPEALLAAARGTGRAIVLTNLSLLLGFGVMLLSAFVPVQRFGMLVGVTMFAGTFSTVIVLPALLTLVLPRPTARRLQEASASGGEVS